MENLVKKIEKFLNNVSEVGRYNPEVNFDFKTSIEIFYDIKDYYKTKNKKRYVDDDLSTELDITISVVGIYINDEYRIKSYDVFADEALSFNNINIRKNQDITRMLNKLLTSEQIDKLKNEIIDRIEEEFTEEN